MTFCAPQVGTPVSASKAPQVDTHLFEKTRICKFYVKGRCKRGASCMFAHNERELRPQPDFFKTQLCIDHFRHGSCSMGDACNYAHSPEEIRRTNVPRKVHGETAHEDMVAWPNVVPQATPMAHPQVAATQPQKQLEIVQAKIAKLQAELQLLEAKKMSTEQSPADNDRRCVNECGKVWCYPPAPVSPTTPDHHAGAPNRFSPTCSPPAAAGYASGWSRAPQVSMPAKAPENLPGATGGWTNVLDGAWSSPPPSQMPPMMRDSRFAEAPAPRENTWSQGPQVQVVPMPMSMPSCQQGNIQNAAPGWGWAPQAPVTSSPTNARPPCATAWGCALPGHMAPPPAKVSGGNQSDLSPCGSSWACASQSPVSSAASPIQTNTNFLACSNGWSHQSPMMPAPPKMQSDMQTCWSRAPQESASPFSSFQSGFPERSNEWSQPPQVQKMPMQMADQSMNAPCLGSWSPAPLGQSAAISMDLPCDIFSKSWGHMEKGQAAPVPEMVSDDLQSECDFSACENGWGRQSTGEPREGLDAELSDDDDDDDASWCGGFEADEEVARKDVGHDCALEDEEEEEAIFVDMLVKNTFLCLIPSKAAYEEARRRTHSAPPVRSSN
mmetsp:Transcript_63063/g.181407  ORF Transcript_63063/g.181407 Transcript_63063/m.181407 type:complete len:609 (+) Transcript_63063:77-1903(+)